MQVETTTCLICGSGERVDYGEKNSIRFAKCTHCGYVAASPMPGADELAELYDSQHFHSSYHPEEAQDTKLLEQRQRQYVLDRDHCLEFAAGGRLLDYGCGNGQFLGVFPETFEKHGYEFNRVTTDYLREKGAFEVLDTEDEVRALPDGHFDAVTMRGVIEHLVDPLATLELLTAKLRTGGVLYICATPNVDSPCALLYGVDWNQFTPPFHLHHFSPRTLALAGARRGLALVDCRFPYLGTPYENESEDGARFIEDAGKTGDGSEPVTSPPFPGTMMSLVFRKRAS